MHSNRLILRTLVALLGFVCVVLGIVGALVPSTVFFICAGACFAYASPRIEAWLLSFDFIGRPVRAWRERGAIALPAKLMATVGMSLGWLAFAFAGAKPLMLAVAAFALALCALSIWTRPD